MRNWKQWALLVLILLAALAFRWTGIDWDSYNHYHPDERYITWVATTIEWPANLADGLIPNKSSLNPFYWYPGAESEGIEVLQDEPRDFAYGHVPLYLGVAATRLVERVGAGAAAILPDGWLLTDDILNGGKAIEFRHLTAVTRALTGLVDAATVLFVFLLGRRLFGVWVGLLAAAFLAVNVMHIQLAHFFTSDPYLAFFGVAALYFMVRAIYATDAQWEKEAEARSPRCGATCNLIVAAIFAGLAVGAKFSATLLALPLATAAWLSLPRPRAGRLLLIFAVALLTFVISNPFAVLDQSCEAISPAISLGPLQIPALNWGSCYLANIVTQGAMVRGQSDLGFTRQYDGTLPYLYPVEMQLRWGMGWPLGLLAFTAFVWVFWKAARPVWRRLGGNDKEEEARLSPRTQSMVVLLVWALPFFITTGSFYVKFMRYLLPLTPLLMIFGAALIFEIRDRRIRLAVLLLVLLPTAVYALSFMNIYRSDHPWDEASRWVYENIPSGTLIASEQWDDALPTTMIVDDRLRRRDEYRDVQLTWLTGPDELDNEAKLQRNLDRLAEAEYVTLMSNRVYGVVPRLADRYPLSSVYHQLLLNGSLGYEAVYSDTRVPGLLGIYLRPDSFVWPGLQAPPVVKAYLDQFRGLNGGRFDESFTVYDQPLVMIFKNVGQKSAAEMRELFPDS
ncbi:MAG: phospholipid carrier-dependent glycosyltransferase [Candidatus Promineifilaceae bacterium]